MNRVLIICLCVLAFAGCKKTDDGLKAVQAQAAIDDKLIADYIVTNKLHFTKVQIGSQDTTGIWYSITTPGTINSLITSSSLLTVGYTGRQMGNSTAFTQTDTFHPSYHFGEMISGWRLGLSRSGIKKGGTVRLLMASRYAYGPFPQDLYHLPANAILDFDIELFDVTN
jgi:FKBP-type peptidyl-prolyl cis-trans isomerase FkpA